MTTTASPLAFISTVTSVLDKSDVSRWKLKYFVVPIYCVVCLVGSVGNAMVIYIMQARVSFVLLHTDNDETTHTVQCHHNVALFVVFLLRALPTLLFFTFGNVYLRAGCSMFA